MGGFRRKWLTTKHLRNFSKKGTKKINGPDSWSQCFRRTKNCRRSTNSCTGDQKILTLSRTSFADTARGVSIFVPARCWGILQRWDTVLAASTSLTEPEEMTGSLVR